MVDFQAIVDSEINYASEAGLRSWAALLVRCAPKWKPDAERLKLHHQSSTDGESFRIGACFCSFLNQHIIGI